MRRPQPSAAAGPHIPALDGLRGLAILMVLVYHFALWSSWTKLEPTDAVANAVCRVAGLGWAGVDLFFVLSGFLITGSLIETRDSPRFFRSFYGRRLVRIFPLYYGVLAAIFVAAPLLGPARGAAFRALEADQGWLWAYGANVAQALRGGWRFDVGWLDLNHLWSLAVEEHFYLVWPAVVRLSGRRGLAWACLVCIVGAPLLRVILTLAGYQPICAYVLTPCRVDSLAIGGLMALAARGPGGLASLAVPARWLTGLGAVAAGALGAIAGGFAPLSLGMRTLGYSALGAIAGGVLILTLIARPGGAWQRLWTVRPLRWLGRYSYGLYLYHHLFGRRLVAILQPALAGADGALYLAGLLAIAAVGLGVSLALAALSFHLLETPFLRLKRFFPY